MSPEQVSPAHPQMPWHSEFSGALTGFSPGNLGRSTRREARNLGAHSRPTSCSHALRDRDKLALCMGTLALTRGGPNPARRHSQVPLRGCEPGLDLPGSWPLTPCPHQGSPGLLHVSPERVAGRTRPRWLGKRENFSARWGSTGEDRALESQYQSPAPGAEEEENTKAH